MQNSSSPRSAANASFQKRLDSAKEAIEKSGLNQALIIHHDEADGLCSGALTKLALEALGLETRLICLDKLYPEVVKDIESGTQQVIAYSDIGSGHVDWLSKWNRTKNLILALDHHDTKDLGDPKVHNINPELDGISGESDACSATIAYLFFRTVSPSADRFAPLAVIGSIEIPGETRGLNKLPLEHSETLGAVRQTGKGGLKLDRSGILVSLSRVSTALNVLSSVGYYRNGPEMGIRACLHGFDSEALHLADRFEKERKLANQRMLSEIRETGLAQMKSVQWFHAHDNYMGMSGKVVGSFCSYLAYQRFVNPAKYLIGMMNFPPDIPGWGRLPSALVKVSGRAPSIISKLVEAGKRPPLSKILPEACQAVGGFGDGHTVASSGVFPVGSEENFLNSIDNLATTES